MRKELKQPSGLSGRDLLALVATLLFLGGTVFFLVVMLLGCEAGDDSDTDVDCDAQYCWDTETHTETEAEAVDTEAEPGCTADYTGYDSCHCASAYVCDYENVVTWAPGCDENDDPNDMEPANVCCCYTYE